MLEYTVILNISEEGLHSEKFYKVHVVPSPENLDLLTRSRLQYFDATHSFVIFDNIWDATAIIKVLPYHLIEILSPVGKRLGVVQITRYDDSGRSITRRLSYVKHWIVEKKIYDDAGNPKIVKEKMQKEVLFEESKVLYLYNFGKQILFHFGEHALRNFEEFKYVVDDENILEMFLNRYEDYYPIIKDFDTILLWLTAMPSTAVIYSGDKVDGYAIDVTNPKHLFIKRLVAILRKVVPDEILRLASTKRAKRPFGEALGMYGEGELVTEIQGAKPSLSTYRHGKSERELTEELIEDLKFWSNEVVKRFSEKHIKITIMLSEAPGKEHRGEFEYKDIRANRIKITFKFGYKRKHTIVVASLQEAVDYLQMFERAVENASYEELRRRFLEQ